MCWSSEATVEGPDLHFKQDTKVVDVRSSLASGLSAYFKKGAAESMKQGEGHFGAMRLADAIWGPQRPEKTIFGGFGGGSRFL